MASTQAQKTSESEPMPDTPSQPAPRPRTEWSDPFARPTRELLIAALPPEEGQAFAAVLEQLTGRKGCRERIEWTGLPWRWTVVVGHASLDHPDLAYLVADPERPVLCIPVPVAGPNAPARDGLTKPVRQMLDNSAIIAGYVWPEWSVADVDLVALAPLLDARIG